MDKIFSIKMLIIKYKMKFFEFCGLNKMICKKMLMINIERFDSKKENANLFTSF